MTVEDRYESLRVIIGDDHSDGTHQTGKVFAIGHKCPLSLSWVDIGDVVYFDKNNYEKDEEVELDHNDIKGTVGACKVCGRE